VIRAAAGLAIVLLVAAGCSASDPSPTADPSATAPSGPATATAPTASTATTASTAATASPTGNRGIDPDLASAAQSLAASAQAQVTGMGQPIPPRDPEVVGGDVSWPQCPAGMGIPHKISTGAPMPTDDAEYVVIGLTNGPGFHANPCLADQVAWVKARRLLVAAYSVISWPDDAAQQQYRGLRQAGYAQAQFNIASMDAVGLDSPIVWLDIEHVPFYDWSTDPAANAEVVLGAAQGYVDAGYRVGVYSTPHLWQSVVGDLSLGVPEWRAAGQTSRQEALSRCGNDWLIQGGVGALAQWVEGGRDVDITCPGTETVLGDYFTQT
jgi:hypothetical protein